MVAPLRLFSLCGLLLAFALNLHATTKLDEPMPVLRTGFVEFPPFKYADESGEASGPWVEMTELVAAEAGYRIEWIHLPIARVYLYLREGRIDLWPGVADIPDLRGHVHESTVTPMRVSLYAFHQRGTKSPKSLKDLSGAPLILISGFTYLGALESGDLYEEDLSYAPDHRAALRMLELGRGQYVLDYDEPVAAVKDRFPGLDLTGSPIYEARGAFVVSAARPDARDLARKFDEAYEALVKQGRVNSLQ